MTMTANSPKRPSHRLYHVSNGEKPFWTPIGAAWPNADSNGFSIFCDAIPLDGRVVMRVIKPRDDNADQGRLV